MTLRKGKGALIVLAACAALLVPIALASGHTSYKTSRATTPFSISFTKLTRNGTIVAVKKLKFAGLKANCNNGKKVSIHGRAPRTSVNNNKFRVTVRKGGGSVKIKGEFRHHGETVRGRLRADGHIGNAYGCFGVRNFKATQR